MVNRKLLKVKFPIETGCDEHYEELNYDYDVSNRREIGQKSYEDELVEYVFIYSWCSRSGYTYSRGGPEKRTN